MADESSRTPVSLLVPMVGSVLQTYGAVWLICGTPWHGTLTWLGVLRTSMMTLVVTLAAHVVAVRINRRLFREQVDAPVKVLVFAIWPVVVWVPLLVLLVRENSVWRGLVPPIVLGSAAVRLRRWVRGSNGVAAEGSVGEVAEIKTLFQVERGRSFARAMGPAMLTALAVEVAVAVLALGRPLAAGWLLAAATVFPVWRVSGGMERLRISEDAGAEAQAVLPRTLVVLLLLSMALVPYLRSSGLSAGLARALAAWMQAKHAAAAAGTNDSTNSGAPGRAYSGVVLLVPSKRREEIAVPAPASLAPVSGVRKPVTIRFDGAYWYFKAPDVRPRADAPVVRGDPTKKEIRSTDLRPLTMEAHQRLSTPISMRCCRAIRVRIENAETRPGLIRIEVRLRDRAVDETGWSLGERVLRSSEDTARSLGRPPEDEVLRFEFPLNVGGREFDEITVVVKPAGDRARGGAHVAVESFELTP